MGKFVKIQAQEPYRVYGGLQTKNVTSDNPANPNRLNVEVLWTDCYVILKRGTFYYPSVIKNWDAVQNLVKQEILSIGEEVDVVQDDEKAAYAKEMYDRLTKAYSNLEKNGFDNPMKEKVVAKTPKKVSATKNLIDETNESEE